MVILVPLADLLTERITASSEEDFASGAKGEWGWFQLTRGAEIVDSHYTAPTGQLDLGERAPKIDVNSLFFWLPEGATLRVGRLPANEVMLPFAAISRTHAKLRVGEPWTIEDTGSRYGTVVDGRFIESRVPMPSGTMVSLAGHVFLHASVALVYEILGTVVERGGYTLRRAPQKA